VQLLSVIVQKAGQKYISMRTKQGLAALKAAGKELGRPKGSQNKKARVLTSTKIKL
jgi:DNA invertase Pin-like site-specific DNA recombinase